MDDSTHTEHRCYEKPHALRLGGAPVGAGDCSTGSGDRACTGHGNSAGTFCGSSGNSATNCEGLGSGAGLLCNADGSSALTQCNITGSGAQT